MPEEFLAGLKSRIKQEWRLAFWAAAGIGYLIHLYVFTNDLPNHDGLINLYSSQLKFQSGRFFLAPFAGISSFLNLPWINGTLSVLYLSLLTVVITEIFELKKAPAIILTAGVITAFPTVSATFAYMFTADAYFLSFLLAVTGILIAKKYRFGFLPASLLLYFSVGTYQANLTLVLTLVTLWFVRELLFKQLPLGRLWIELGKYALMTILSMAWYALTFIIYKDYLNGAISAYQGINQIGQINGFREPLILAYENFRDFFFRGFISADYPVNLFEILNLLLSLLIICGVVLAGVQSKVYRSPLRIILILGCFLLFPLFSFLLYFSSPGIEYHMLMVMALAPFYLLPLMIYDRLQAPKLPNKWYAWSTVGVLFLIVFNFALIANMAYFNMHLKYEKAYAVANRVLDRIEQTAGYEKATKIAVIGWPKMTTDLATKVLKRQLPGMTGAMWDNILEKPYHFEAIFANYLGKPFTLVGEQELNSLLESETIKKMPVWPANKSVQIRGDTIILKFSSI